MLLGTLSGLVSFNILFQVSTLLYPSTNDNRPYLLSMLGRSIFESLWLFSYLLRAVYLVIVSYVNGKRLSEEKLYRMSSVRRNSVRRRSVSADRGTIERRKSFVPGPAEPIPRSTRIMVPILLRFLWARKENGRFILANSIYSIKRMCQIMATFFVIQCIISLAAMFLTKNEFLKDMTKPTTQVKYDDNEYILISIYALILSFNLILLYLVRNGMSLASVE